MLLRHLAEIAIEMFLVSFWYMWAMRISGGYLAWGFLLVVPAFFITTFLLSLLICTLERIKKDNLKIHQIIILKTVVYSFSFLILYVYQLGK